LEGNGDGARRGNEWTLVFGTGQRIRRKEDWRTILFIFVIGILEVILLLLFLGETLEREWNNDHGSLELH